MQIFAQLTSSECQDTQRHTLCRGMTDVNIAIFISNIITALNTALTIALHESLYNAYQELKKV